MMWPPHQNGFSETVLMMCQNIHFQKVMGSYSNYLIIWSAELDSVQSIVSHMQMIQVYMSTILSIAIKTCKNFNKIITAFVNPWTFHPLCFSYALWSCVQWINSYYIYMSCSWCFVFFSREYLKGEKKKKKESPKAKGDQYWCEGD